MIDLKFNNISRATTKEEWRSIDRYRRVTQAIMRKKMEASEEDIRKCLVDELVFGQSVCCVDADGVHHVPLTDTIK